MGEERIVGMSPEALSGIRVVGLSNTIAGVRASQLLADFGAEVVEIEPVGGSPLRIDPAWPLWDRRKKSIELDLKAPEDLEVAGRLAAAADVVIDTFRPGVAERLGLGYEGLASRNPRLVYTSITGFGRQGPLADLQGYEPLALAKIGGLQAFGRMVERPGPAMPVIQYGSFSAAQTALHGTLAALYEREASGRGQWVETSVLQGLAAHDTFNWFVRVISEKFPGAFTRAAAVVDGVPSGGLAFRLVAGLTADGRWLQFSQTSEHLFRAFMRAVGLDWMFDDPKWCTLPDFEDVAQRVKYWEMLLEAIHSRTLAEWQAVFDDDPNVWGELYRHGIELLDHPQMIHDGWVMDVVEGSNPPMRQLAPMVKMSKTPGRSGTAPARNANAPELRARPAPAVPDSGTEEVSCRAPLEGVTVVELSLYYAAPFGATILGELGARVIKLEPLAGDQHRYMLPEFPETAAIKVLQGKESVAVDLATDEGRQIAYDIIARADAVLQSYRAGAAERLGVDPDRLMAVNPNLVYLTSPGYGSGGPCGHRPAYAPTIAAAAGMGWRNAAGTIPEDPGMSLDDMKANSMRLRAASSGFGHPDGFASLGVATALLLGLVARQRGAGGQTMKTSMLSTTAHALADDMIDYAGRWPAVSAGPDFYGLSALYRLYEAADGWIFLAAPTQREWTRFSAAIEDRVDIARDPRFATADERQRHNQELAEVLRRVFLDGAARAWEEMLRKADVGCVEVCSGPYEDWLLDPNGGRASGFVTETTHPLIGDHPRLAPLVRFSRSATRADAACLVGQHTRSVLSEFGYSNDRIDELAERGIIRC